MSSRPARGRRTAPGPFPPFAASVCLSELAGGPKLLWILWRKSCAFLTLALHGNETVSSFPFCPLLRGPPISQLLPPSSGKEQVCPATALWWPGTPSSEAAGASVSLFLGLSGIVYGVFSLPFPRPHLPQTFYVENSFRSRETFVQGEQYSLDLCCFVLSY